MFEHVRFHDPVDGRDQAEDPDVELARGDQQWFFDVFLDDPILLYAFDLILDFAEVVEDFDPVTLIGILPWFNYVHFFIVRFLV